MSLPDDSEDIPEPTWFERLSGSLPPALKAALEAQAAQYAQAQELGRIDFGMQAAALHEYYKMLVGAGFERSEALYYLSKVSPGL